MAAPRVSFIVTCFNLGAYLPETLASLRAQTFTDHEICVVDDGSTDARTRQVLGELGPDVVVVLSENRGLSAARNLGLQRTSGEFICAVDADDILLPTLVERSVARLDAEPSLTFVSHWLEAFGDESWEWKPERCDFPALLDMNTVSVAALVRRPAVEEIGGWDGSLRYGFEDWNLWISLVERGHRGAIIPEILFRYRQRPDSMSRVNFAGNGHARLYRQLVARHPDTFRRHLKQLLVRRNSGCVAALAMTADLRDRLELDALPALARARDDAAAAERRRARYGLDSSRHRAAAEQRRAHDELNARCQRAEAEVAALRGSLSWRITQPLRSVGGLVNRALRRHS